MKRPTVIRVVVAVVLVPLVAFGAYALRGLSDFELNRSARAGSTISSNPTGRRGRSACS
ncbi:hypothetical protein [Burkholderia ubonensis]|uniref:hypothetical protein n=1 Tax=Burkholderia ubonensis TaxID=101571 RepID=UPI0018DFBF7E|nr:hypothetical protein [Burkholderia ubonensis]